MKKIILLFMILLLIPLAYSNTDYNETGNFNSQFQAGTGFFNTQLTDTDSFTKTITTQRLSPLVSDLDGDGINEIIILDSSNVRLFHNKELDILDSISLNSSSRYSNMIAYNIDGDSNTELILADEINNILFILEYNGSAFTQQNYIDISNLNNRVNGSNDGEILIKCRDVNKCLMVFVSDIDNSNPLGTFIMGLGFNSTDLENTFEGTIIDDGSTFDQFCFPKIRTMSVADYDNDLTDEFIFSYMNLDITQSDELKIAYIDLGDDLSVTLEQTITENEILDITSSGSDTCNADDFGRYFTAPLVFDGDGSAGTGLETIIGYNTDADEFKMRIYKSDGSDLDEHPETFLADGTIISNVIQTNAFSQSSDSTAYCVAGYDDTDEEIDLLCGSKQETFSFLGVPFETREFLYDITGLYNITQSYGVYNVLIHSAQHSTETTNGVNLNEITTSYGIFSLDIDNTCRTQIPPIRCLNRIFENPYEDATLISVDAEKKGREDLIALTSTNLWYISDKFVNSPAQIDEYLINPCIDSTWKLNSTLEIRITPLDVDDDNVGARAIIYQGSSNEQDTGWSNNVSSGTTITFSDFFINKTIGTGTIRLMARDVENPTDTDIIDLTFSVGNNGVEQGDCTTEVSGIVEQIQANATLTQEAQDIADLEETIESSFDTLGVPFITSQIFWIILMIIIAVVIWTSEESFIKSPQMAFGLILLVEVLMLILGTLFGFIGAGILISVVVIGLIAVAMWLRKTFSSSI